MSDERIRNVSALEKALQSSFPQPTPTLPNLSKPEPSPPSHPEDHSSYLGTPTSPYPTLYHHEVGARVNSPTPSSKDRTSTYQLSSNQLLVNLCGLQTTSNSKIDILTDSVLRLNKTMEGIADEQRKQTELLVRIMQNTAEPTRVVSESNSQGTKTTTQSGRKCSDYGFSNVTNVLSEFILQILKQTEIQVKSHNKGYRSSRTMERTMLDKAIKVLSENEFKVGGVRKPKLDLPTTKSESCIYLASKIGSTDTVKPIITPHYMIQLFNDPSCRTMMSTIEEIMSRLKAIRCMIPYYEADMINALSYPYFDGDGKVICNWGDLNPRSETDIEAKIMSTKIQRREMLGKLLVLGIDFDKAVSTALRDS